MFKKNYSLFAIALLALVCISTLQAQDRTSPYSRYGYGILKDQITGISKGMGGASYGIRNSYGANVANPASYSAVDSLTFLFDMGFYFNAGTLKDNSGSKSDYNGGIEYITMLFPVSENLGVSAGILPYSTVGYKHGTITEDGGISHVKLFSGSGGVSQVYVGAGYEIPFIKGLSLGSNASYMFGKLRHSRSIPEIAGGISNLTASDTELRISQLKFDLGVQYEIELNSANNLTLGATYSPKINSTSEYTRYQKMFNTSGNIMEIDTLSVPNASTGIPHSLGVGASWNYKEKWLLAADITYQHWEGVNFSSKLEDGLNNSNRFNNRWRYNVGGEYVSNPYDMNFFKRVKIRGGANFSNSYMNAINQLNQVKGYNEYGFTFGFGIPLFDRSSFGERTSYVNVNFEYKKMKPKVSNMITESYYGVTIGVTLNERWFFKRKIY